MKAVTAAPPIVDTRTVASCSFRGLARSAREIKHGLELIVFRTVYKNVSTAATNVIRANNFFFFIHKTMGGAVIYVHHVINL